MRGSWQRPVPPLTVSVPEAEELIAPICPGGRVLHVGTLDGGLRNTNLRLAVAGREQELVLRLYQQDPETALKEAALSARLSGRVPMARFLHHALSNPVTGGAYALLEWIEGDRLDAAVLRANPEDATKIGCAVGRTLAAIHDITFDRFGFLDGGLQVARPVDLGTQGILAFLDDHLVQNIGGRRLGADLMSGLYSFIRRDGHLLEAWGGKPCLVHSDFNGSNILVRDDEHGNWQVSAVLDWEFAFSGNPAFDLGNLLRAPLGTLSDFEGAVARGYREAGRLLPSNWRRIARIADLTAWVDFLARAEVTETVIEDARRVIRQTIGVW